MKKLFLFLFLGLAGSSCSLLFGGGDVATNDPIPGSQPWPEFPSTDGDGIPEITNIPLPSASTVPAQ